MMKNIIVPFFSVVIPLYNKEKYIRRCLDSVLNQSCSDFEIVVVDDGSTDNSSNIVSSFQDPRIRLTKQTNAGVSAARNRGIAEARCEWIAFLDADDEWLPTFLEEVTDCIKAFPEAGAVYCDPIWMRNDVRINKLSDESMSPQLLKDYFHHVVFSEINEIHSSCVAVKKEVFSRVGTFPVGVKVGEDSDMWMRVAWTTAIAHIPKGLSIYHMDAGGSNWEEEKLKEAYWVQTYRYWLSERLIPECLLRSSGAYYQRYVLEKALYNTLNGKKAEAFKILISNIAWKTAPKKYALKVLLYLFLPVARIRSLLNNNTNNAK